MVKIDYNLEDNNIIQEYKLIIDGKLEPPYNTELIVPKSKDKISIVFVVGNPAIPSVKNGFPYSYGDLRDILLMKY